MTFSQLPLDWIVAPDPDWECPDEFKIDRATYDEWVIGTW